MGDNKYSNLATNIIWSICWIITFVSVNIIYSQRDIQITDNLKLSRSEVYTITAFSTRQKGYKGRQMVKGECSVSQDSDFVIGDFIYTCDRLLLVVSTMDKYDGDGNLRKKRIDIYIPEIKNCIRFGRKRERVRIIKEAQ